MLSPSEWSGILFQEAAVKRLQEWQTFLETQEDIAYAQAAEQAIRKQLNYLNNYGGKDEEGNRRYEIVLGYDFAPLSFSVMFKATSCGCDMYGGLIWYGVKPEEWRRDPRQNLMGVHT